MELSFLPRSLWVNDGKFQHHHLTDLFTTVQVTRDLPLGATFGPCILQNTFYDTIAFIALKSCDKRNKSYVFRVDAEAMSISPMVSWLRFVQAASNKEEQNMEAFVKCGRLYFRSVRNIRQEEELLVWYDAELCHLLGFNEIKSKAPSDGFKCMNCTQTFANEHPYLAHCRFLCAQMKSDFPRRELYEQKTLDVNQQAKSRVTDFHNIARDLEHKKSSSEDATYVAQLRKRRQDETECPRPKKSVLLEKTNMLTNANDITNISKDFAAVPDIAVSVLKLNEKKYVTKKDLPGYKHSAFTEVKRIKEKLKEEKTADTANKSARKRCEETCTETDSRIQSTGSAFSFVFPNGAREELKSAFCKPNKRTVSESTAHPSHSLNGLSEHPEDVSEAITSNSILGYSSLLGSGLSGAQSISKSVSTTCEFPYALESWFRSTGIQLQTASSLALLPPTFTCFGVSVQNWCAKCSLSFRMTSDLVFHMRSHHKKEFATESQVRRREDKLTCPICHEYFRERHHLSRHMTSHN